MNAIVMNTLTGAVSEYSGFDFHALTPSYAGSAVGLYSLGGDLDLSAAIVANVVTGKTLLGGSLKKSVDAMFVSVKGAGTSAATVYGENDSYEYTFTLRPSGEARVKPGRGIRENYLAFGYSNIDGSDFELDRIEAEIFQSNSRRS